MEKATDTNTKDRLRKIQAAGERAFGIIKELKEKIAPKETPKETKEDDGILLKKKPR